MKGGGGGGGGGRGARRNWDARAPRLSPAGEIPRGKIAASSPHPIPRPLCARPLRLSSLTRRPPILHAFGAGGRHALSSGCDVNTPSLLASRSCPALVRPRIRPTSSLGHHHYLWNARGRRLSCRGRLKEAAARGALLALGASCPHSASAPPGPGRAGRIPLRALVYDAVHALVAISFSFPPALRSLPLPCSTLPSHTSSPPPCPSSCLPPPRVPPAPPPWSGGAAVAGPCSPRGGRAVMDGREKLIRFRFPNSYEDALTGRSIRIRRE